MCAAECADSGLISSPISTPHSTTHPFLFLHLITIFCPLTAGRTGREESCSLPRGSCCEAAIRLTQPEGETNLQQPTCQLHVSTCLNRADVFLPATRGGRAAPTGWLGSKEKDLEPKIKCHINAVTILPFQFQVQAQNCREVIIADDL